MSQSTTVCKRVVHLLLSMAMASKYHGTLSLTQRTLNIRDLLNRTLGHARRPKDIAILIYL